MITVTKLPEKISLSGNEVIVALKSNNYQLASGTKAKIVLFFACTGPSPSFTLFIFGQYITFTMGTVDSTGTKFPAYHYPDSQQTWNSKIAAALALNYYILKYFDVSYDNQHVILTAKDYGPSYNLSATVHDMIPTFVNQNISGVDSVYRSMFFIDLEVQIYDNSKWVSIGEDYVNIDSNGLATSDIHSYLKPYTSSDFAFPESSNTFFYKRSLRKYRLRVSETWYENGEMVHQAVKEITDMYAAPGGLSKIVLAKLLEAGSNFWYNYQQTKQFLTWHPADKTIGYTTTEKLYFILWKAATQLNEKVRYTFGSGTQGVVTKSLAAPELYSIYEIIVTPSKLGINPPMIGLASDYLSSMEVWLTDQAGNPLTEVRNYTIDQSYYENERVFIFRNSFGVYETLRCTGEQIFNAEYARLQVTNSEGYYKYVRRPEKVNYYNSEDQTFTINTGWLTKEETDWMRDFFLSAERYEIKNGALFPVVVTSDKVFIRQDDNYLYNFAIEYSHGFTDEFYSNENMKIYKPTAKPISDIIKSIDPNILQPVMTIQNPK